MKKWFKVLMLVCVSLLLVGWYVFNNLKFHAVYYAKHTPHQESVDPVLMTLIDELYWIYQIDTSRYEYKDNWSISIMDGYGQKYLYSSYSVSENKQQYSYSGNLEEKKSYTFDEKFKLKYVLDTNSYTKLDINLFDEQAIKREMYEVYKELIDRQPTPSINLQWLFDWLYHDKFN